MGAYNKVVQNTDLLSNDKVEAFITKVFVKKGHKI